MITLDKHVLSVKVPHPVRVLKYTGKEGEVERNRIDMDVGKFKVGGRQTLTGGLIETNICLLQKGNNGFTFP